ncbi:MAG: hypothetical protein H7836_08150 [Magnetococcus sp. YQC-3]
METCNKELISEIENLINSMNQFKNPIETSWDNIPKFKLNNKYNLMVSKHKYTTSLIISPSHLVNNIYLINNLNIFNNEELLNIKTILEEYIIGNL